MAVDSDVPKTPEPSERQGVRNFFESVVARAGSGVDRLRGAASELGAPTCLRHALAAKQRGNLEAAFWLLNEAFGVDPKGEDIAVHYWNAALALGRVDIASPAGLQLVESHAAAGNVDLAAQYWIELIGAAPDVRAAPDAIATILPALKQRLADADEEHAPELRGGLRRAMRHAVNPRVGELHPGVALRLFDEGRELNPEAARRAAEVALRSPHLHDAKRARLEEALGPEAPPACKLFEGVPIELGPEAVVLRSAEGVEVPITYERIDAVSVVEVSGLAKQRVTIIDLIRDWRGPGSEGEGPPPLIARVRGDSFDPAALIPGPCLDGAELAAFLGEILERSHAMPMPDLESALGVQLARFDSLADYEREVLDLSSDSDSVP
jgi:hypothetical protein